LSEGILIGIDGGGTHSTAAAMDLSGRLLAVVPGGGMNFLSDGMECVRDRLHDLVRRVQEACGGAPVASVCLGSAALDGPADKKTVDALSGGPIPSGKLSVQSDAYIALMGLTQGQPGVIVICGTGSMLLMANADGNQIVSGGWGYLLRDAGSGYTLAREALLAIADQTDGVGIRTALTEAALDFFSASSPRALIDRVYAADFSPADMAAFARHVLIQAAKGDEIACEILTRNMRLLARMTAVLMNKAENVRIVGLYGGIFEHSELARNIYQEELTAIRPDADVRSPELPPHLGALIHLIKDNSDKQILETMKNTFREASS